MKRRNWLWILITLSMVIVPALASCAPQPTAAPVIVKETVVTKETVVKEVEKEKVVEVQVTPEPEEELEGTIVISFAGSDTQTWG